ncbi:polymorphic toxin type 50 domain-containing protein [Vagococcus sp.]|uniref:polymorphic toxin type 50 domain-containing protein n=1 Tax=Vagococcus sp. TaxID=1933889 RepID=UPI003F9667A7
MKVWGNYVRDLPKKLDKTLTASMTNGWGVDRTVKAMMKNIDSGLRNRMTTLVQTEMAHLADEASQLAYERKGVKEYEWLATLELHTCELCGNFDGQTFIVGSKNAKRPIVDSHPNCRCTTVPSVNFPGLKRWSRDPITGKGKLVDDMSFNEWRDKYTNPVMLKKVRNESSDKKQYGKYKDILGSKDKPETFDKFQEMKYNEDSGWDQLKDNYFVKSRLKDGRYGSVINQDKQAPHMRSTVAEGKSYFNDDVNVQDLFDKYAGTGTIERQKDGVTRKNTELIIANDFKGVAVSLKGNQETSTFKIHHAKKRTHIVPIKERGES